MKTALEIIKEVRKEYPKMFGDLFTQMCMYRMSEQAIDECGDRINRVDSYTPISDCVKICLDVKNKLR